MLPAPDQERTSAVGVDALLDDPPDDPPAGCVDELTWKLARDYVARHARHEAQGCADCSTDQACRTARLATNGLLTALGRDNPDTDYWQALTKIRRTEAVKASGNAEAA